MVAPICIRFMLACYYSADPRADIGPEQWDSIAGASARMWLHENGLVSNETGARDQITERGRAWVKAICETPLPKSATALTPNEQPGFIDQLKEDGALAGRTA